MDFIIFVVLVAILVILLLIFLMLKRMAVGFSFGSQQRKRAYNLGLIMALFEKYPVLTNTIIRNELKLDRRTIVNYMDELEQLKKVKQVGKVGWEVHYAKV